MNNTTKLKIILEIIWWIVTCFVAALILFPILKTFDHYPFLNINIVFIIVFITWARYIFLLKHTFLAKMIWLKAILIAASIPLVFILVGGIHEFQVFLDEKGPEILFSEEYVKEPLSGSKELRLYAFLRKETLFFGVGSVITAIIFPFRMLISIWRQINRGTV
ncbi:MAG: hypothetical protein AAF502_02705 [Bacteroidota bacterium]